VIPLDGTWSERWVSTRKRLVRIASCALEEAPALRVNIEAMVGKRSRDNAPGGLKYVASNE
jgi:hypothetical protein